MRSLHLISGDGFRQVGFEIKTGALRHVPTKDDDFLPLSAPVAVRLFGGLAVAVAQAGESAFIFHFHFADIRCCPNVPVSV